MSARKILIRLDGSPGSMRAVKFGADLARVIDASIVLLHVHEAPTPELPGLADMSGGEVHDRVQALDVARLREARAELGPEWTDERVIERDERDRLGDEILEVADTEAVDLIVIGSRGLSPDDGLLVGSVNEKVVRRSPCPVTVVL